MTEIYCQRIETMKALRADMAAKVASPETNEGAKAIYEALLRETAPLPGNGCIIIQAGAVSKRIAA